MIPKKKLQVFVSSTYTDLKEERQAAVEAILKAGHIPAGMELFTAGDQSQWEVIKDWIDESDIYLLILGGRYGSIDPLTQKSYTQLEYEYAVMKGKPYFSLVINDEHQENRIKKYGSLVIENKEPKKLLEFRETVSKIMVEFWSDPRDIKASIAYKLAEYSRRPDLKGWIPGDAVISSLKKEDNVIALLTQEAKELLQKAAIGDGEIMMYHTKDGFHLVAGNKEYVGDDDSRKRALWEGTVEELIQNGLLKPSGSNEIYRITSRGYKVADKLKIQEYSPFKLISAPNNGRDMIIHFRNPSKTSLNLIWVDSTGTEKNIKELKVDEFDQIKSFINHAWLVRDAENNAPIIEFKASEYMEGAPGTIP